MWSTKAATPRERELERELQDARAQLDDDRRARERREMEEERASVERRRRMAPSNRLYNGEVTSPRDAIATYIRSLEIERGNDERFAGEMIAEGENPYPPGEWGTWISDAQALLREYDETAGKAERELAERWAAADDGTTKQMCGLALHDGDWSRLAI